MSESPHACRERFYAKILKCFNRELRVKYLYFTLGTFLDFACFSSYLLTKETA